MLLAFSWGLWHKTIKAAFRCILYHFRTFESGDKRLQMRERAMAGFAEVHSFSGFGPFPLLSFPMLTMCAHVSIDRGVSSRRTYICVLMIRLRMILLSPFPPTLPWDSLIRLLQSSTLAFGSEYGTRLLPVSFFPPSLDIYLLNRSHSYPPPHLHMRLESSLLQGDPRFRTLKR